MRLASESAEEEETRLSRCRVRDRARGAAQSSQATKNCRGSETAEARERQRSKKEASRFRKRGGKGDTIIQRDVNFFVHSLIPQNFPAITRVNRLATMSEVRYPRRDAESHRGRQRDVWTIHI